MHKIFLSHVGKESSRARDLKLLIEEAFDSKVSVFVSSDAGDLRPGDNWPQVVLAELRLAESVLVLCSKHSVRRAWINFEAGSGWQAGVPVIPVCHDGFECLRLPAPLAMFQGVQLDDRESMKVLVQRLASHLGLHLQDAGLESTKVRHLAMRCEEASEHGMGNLIVEIDGTRPTSHSLQSILAEARTRLLVRIAAESRGRFGF